MLTQAGFTALSNVSRPVEERLARWLLMCHDRIDGGHPAHPRIPIDHARRPAAELHVIEGLGHIRIRRGIITIVDREAPIAFSDGTYGQPEAEYRRLIGTFG